MADTGWNVVAFGGYSDDGQSILSDLVPSLDKFIDDYLETNDEACDSAASAAGGMSGGDPK